MKIFLWLMIAALLPAWGWAQTVIENMTYTAGTNVTVTGPSTITTGANVIIAGGANVTYTAISQIVLGPGFHAQPGCSFHAIVNSQPVAALNVAFDGGRLIATGWAVDRDDGAPVASVSIYIDGLYVAEAVTGVPRPDIADYAVNSLGYPGPSTRFLGAGFEYAYSPIELGTGLHFVVALVRDRSGASVYTVRRRFNLTAPVVTIDSDGDGIPDYIELSVGSDPHNPSSVPETAATARFQYDANNRLTTDPTRTHKYDVEGNIEGPR
jgi:hypothetical protein